MTGSIRGRVQRFAAGALLGLLIGGGVVPNASAQTQEGTPVLPRYAPATLFDPASNYLLTTDFGKRAHSNLRILVPPSNSFARAQFVAGTPPFSNYLYETPASLACIYNLIPPAVAGCNPNATKTGVTGGSKSIAIVDAYDYPGAQTDLATFSSQFGLPAPSAANFKVVYATGARPQSAYRTGWDLEAALDLDMAHGLAPKAKLYLVEAASNSLGDLFLAVSRAASLVAGDGGGEVSMSWGAGEFSGETAYDGGMTTAKVVYFAASGDSPGAIYPCTSPNVVCVGGTGNSRNVVTGVFQGYVAWTDTGGGTSLYEARPAYQNALSGIVGAKRGVPDIAAVADPRTGVWVYIAAWAGSCVGTADGASSAGPVWRRRSWPRS